MKIIDKIKWRVGVIRKSIINKKLKISDLFYFFKPGSSLDQKKRREEFFEDFGEEFFKKEKDGLLSFNLGKNKFNILPEMKLDSMAEIYNFGSAIYDRNFFIKYKNFNFYSPEGPYEIDGCYLKEGDFVIDAGANLGLFSVLAGSIVGGNGKVFAFEPVSKTREILEKNIRQNNASNCEVSNLALGNSNKDIEIFIDDNNLGASSIVIKSGRKERMELIKQTKLDDFIEQNNVSKVDFIKADIEGAERDLLRGAEKTIKKFKPKIAICTYHLPDDPEVLGGILKEFVPEYNIVHKYKKIYAWI